ncbi:MAG: hypothetical protein IJ455_08295 [Agathobacter sp.]|nr:hypothetical protein [Agathobacter sp.]
MTNKRLLITLLALVMLLLVGCQSNDETPNNDDSETQQQETQQDDTQQNDTQLDINTEDTQLSIPSDVEDAVGTLSAERVEWFEKYYFNLPEKKMRNMFLGYTEYTTAKDIVFHHTFHHGVFGENQTPVSNAEIQLLEQYYGPCNLDVSKVTIAEMDAALQTYAGLSYEETNKVGMNSFYYLEEYDAYYYMGGDSSYGTYDILSGEKHADGTITLQYCSAHDIPANVYEVTIRKVGDEYQFLSNIRVEE